MNYRMKTKKDVQNKMLSNLVYVLMNSLTILLLEDCVKDNCSDFLIFAEKYKQGSLLLMRLQQLGFQLF